MREVHLPESIEQLKPGDHLCCIYETEEQHRDLLTPFLSQGLIQQEKVFYIIDHHSSGDILDYLQSAGLKVELYLDTGQLRILAPEDTYLRNRVFDPHEMIALLDSSTKQALAEGWAGLRVTGEMTWALQGMPGSDRLIENEAELNKFLPGSHCITLCQYDRHRFEPQVLLNVLRTHPTAVIGTEIYRNFYYVSPEALLGTRPVEVELQRWIENLVEHKRAVEALRKSEEYQRAMIAASPLAIFSLDPDGRVLTWNKAAEGIFGWSEEEVVGRFLPIVPEDQLEIFTKLRERVIGGEEFSQIELTRRRKDGSDIEVSFSAAPIRDKSGRAVGVMAALQDITERKLAEEEKKDLEAQLRRSQKMESIGRLAGGVAHDFNNMLSVILGHTQLAIDKIGPDDQLYQDLSEVLTAAKRSTQITRQLLAFARKQAFSPQVLDLNETIDGMLKMLQRLIGEDLELAWLPGKELWPVKMDPSQVDQILANLCVNARDALGGGGGKITIETHPVTLDQAYCAAHPDVSPGEYVLLAVSDNGCGMDRETRDRVFEPFFTTKDLNEGTGLGLSTVYGIVKQNSGFINVYSEPGRGTTFKIYLPRNTGNTEQVRTRDNEQLPLGRGETVLIVEDEASVLELSQRMLEKLGYTVLTGSTPGEAIELAEETSARIDLLMTDVVMPEMNGKEFAQRLRARHPDLKVLFMSGYPASIISTQGQLGEDINFLEKPFSMSEMAFKVREALGGRLRRVV